MILLVITKKSDKGDKLVTNFLRLCHLKKPLEIHAFCALVTKVTNFSTSIHEKNKKVYMHVYAYACV